MPLFTALHSPLMLMYGNKKQNRQAVLNQQRKIYSNNHHHHYKNAHIIEIVYKLVLVFQFISLLLFFSENPTCDRTPKKG